MKVLSDGEPTDAPPGSTDARPESNAERSDDIGDETEFESDPLPLSQVFEILRNERRRRVLRVLRARGGSSTLSEVAELLAARENDKAVSELTSDERKRTYVGLYQCHLPKMDDSGVITFDKHRGDIRLGPRSDRVFEYLDDEDTRPWARYYLALAGVWGGVLLLGALSGIAALTSPAVVALQVFTFALCSVAHYHSSVDGDGDGPSLYINESKLDAA